jgi:hypothetical protein
MFTSRRRGPVTSHNIHKVMDAKLAKVMKNNRSESGDESY